MLEVHRYECILQAGGYRLKVNIHTVDPKDVEALARLKAAEYLKRVHALPSTVMSIKLMDKQDKGPEGLETVEMLIPSAYAMT